MAKQTTQQPVAERKPAPDIEDGAQYEVKLSKAVKHGAMWLRPRDRLVLSGKVVKDLGDVVESATKV